MACRSLVDVELLAEVTRIAIGADIVPQRRTAHLDRKIEHRLDRAYQARKLRSLQPPCNAAWIDPGTEQGFARVDVADADDDLAVQQQLLDGDTSPAGHALEIFGVEARIERLRGKTAQEWMRERIAIDP